MEFDKSTKMMREVKDKRSHYKTKEEQSQAKLLQMRLQKVMRQKAILTFHLHVKKRRNRKN